MPGAKRKFDAVCGELWAVAARRVRAPRSRNGGTSARSYLRGAVKPSYQRCPRRPGHALATSSSAASSSAGATSRSATVTPRLWANENRIRPSTGVLIHNHKHEPPTLTASSAALYSNGQRHADPQRTSANATPAMRVDVNIMNRAPHTAGETPRPGRLRNSSTSDLDTGASVGATPNDLASAV